MSRALAKAKLRDLLMSGKALEAIEFWASSTLSRGAFIEANELAARAVLEGIAPKIGAAA